MFNCDEAENGSVEFVGLFVGGDNMLTVTGQGLYI